MTVVNTNVAAFAAQTSMMKNTRELEDAMAKLSSGQRINTAADDAAGMSISERLDSQIRGLSQAIRNAQDGQNLIDTVEGASGEIVVALQRLRELAVQSATDTNSAVDRGALEDTVVEDGAIIDNMVQIGHGARVGTRTAIAAQAGISGSTRIGARCVIAGQAGMAGHLSIADDVHIGGQGRVASSVTEPGHYSSGTPVQPLRAWLRSASRFTQLDQMARRIAELEKVAGLDKKEGESA